MGLGLSKTFVDDDSSSLIEAIKILSNAIPYLGPILSGLIDIFLNPKPDHFAEIKEQLNRMDSHLFAIENKIDALARQVTQTSVLTYYKSRAERINLIEMSYQRYLNTPTNITKKELIENCQRNNILEYVYYVHKELTDSGSILSLMDVMKDNYNLANFQIWMKMLAGSISQSMMLHTICMFAEYQDHTDLNVTMDGDISYFENVSRIMLNVVKDGTNDIKQNFFEAAAKHEILSYAAANRDKTHIEFGNDVWNILTKKYYFRHWFVLSYDPQLYGYGNHCVTWTGKYVNICVQILIYQVH